MQRSVGPVGVVVVDEHAEHTLELAAAHDQELVEALSADGAVLMILIPSLAKIASKSRVNFVFTPNASCPDPALTTAMLATFFPANGGPAATGRVNADPPPLHSLS
jgi:hypothetical protein